MSPEVAEPSSVSIQFFFDDDVESGVEAILTVLHRAERRRIAAQLDTGPATDEEPLTTNAGA